MPERECTYIIITNPSLVVRGCYKCIGLFLRNDIEHLAINSLEGALNDCISLLVCLKDTLVHIDILHTRCLPSITTLRGTPFAASCTTCFSFTRHYIFGLSPTNSVIQCMLCSSLKMGPGNFLLKMRNDSNERNLLLSTSCS